MPLADSCLLMFFQATAILRMTSAIGVFPQPQAVQRGSVVKHRPKIHHHLITRDEVSGIFHSVRFIQTFFFRKLAFWPGFSNSRPSMITKLLHFASFHFFFLFWRVGVHQRLQLMNTDLQNNGVLTADVSSSVKNLTIRFCPLSCLHLDSKGFFLLAGSTSSSPPAAVQLTSSYLPDHPIYCQFSFYFQMSGADHSLSILSSDDSGPEWREDWTKSVQTEGQWRFAAININRTGAFRLIVQASVGGKGYVAVDDLSFRRCGTGENFYIR